MFIALSNLATRRPGRVLITAAIVAIVSLAVSNGLPDRLAAQGFANMGAESQKAADAVSKATGYDPDLDIVALVSAPGDRPVTSPEGRAAIADAQKRLAKLDGVVAVSPGAVSSDGATQMVIAHTEQGSADSGVAENAVDTFAGDYNVQLGGALVAQHYVSETVSSDLSRSEMIAFPLLFLISLLVFRSLIAAALPLLIGAITIPLTMMMISFYNEATSLSIFALNLTTGLGLGLAIDYALLTITRYREEIAAGADTRQAVATTMNTAGRTIVYSAMTVAGAVLVLAIFPLKFLYSMAFAGATVAIASAVVALTVLPAVLYLLGPKIDRFSIARKPIDESTRRWYGLANGVMKRPALVAIAVTLVILVLASPIRNMSFTSVDATVLPSTNQAHQVQDRLAEDFPAAQTSTVFVQVDAPKGDAEKVAALRADVAETDGVEAVAKPVYLGDDTWRFDVQTDELFYEPSALDAVQDIRGIDSAETFRVGGTSAVFVDQRATILDRIPLALLLILLITFVVLFLMTGSVVLPIKTFIMNLLTLAATFGVLTWIFGEGHLEGLLGYQSQGALEMTQPVLLFVISFALATDYGVFLLGRIKELHDQGLGNHEAVAQGLARTGRVITSAALLFCVAIGAFSLSGIVFIKELGVGTALAVAIDATLIRALLVPALMALLGEYNWWAPRWMKRLHARFGLSEGPSAPAAETAAEPA
ncbi:MAG: MMPL family transporter [Solirubrobacterales bacterium]